MKIEDLNLSVRASNALRRAGIRTTKQLMSMDAGDLLRIRNLGHKSLDEIQKTIAALEELERKEQSANAPHGSYLHGYQEGKEGMRRAAIRELTKMGRRMDRENQELISMACSIIREIEVQ